ncbi:PaaI family thioesterase [uncultured Aliivibrio sp.]|uniref:PaaI family thioesterase n=1 Tax=uncultured Aliivibrio sp. TaxID=873085 RepID=UPI00261B1AC9|nr:PaaI family thioesterase [uncultured Aliivibrio sp.]
MSLSIPKDHQQCCVCQHAFFSEQPIIFQVSNDQKIYAEIIPTEKVEGYDGVMQGGLITALHDSAMLHCLYSHEIHAMTVSLSTRFHRPIKLGVKVEVHAEWVSSRRNLHVLQSKIIQEGHVCSSAKSQFMDG